MYGSQQDSKKFLILIIVAAVVLAVVFTPRGNKRRSVSGLKDPVQKEAVGSVNTEAAGYDIKISFAYSYDIEALVVSAKDYSGSSVGDKLAPKDLALAWGKVAEYNDRMDFHWKQSGRFYYWRLDSWDEAEKLGGESVIVEHSCNNHLIPADDMIKKQIKKIKAGDHIRLKGYLVNIAGTDKNGREFWWDTSTTRSDSGGGACELIYVTSVENYGGKN